MTNQPDPEDGERPSDHPSTRKPVLTPLRRTLLAVVVPTLIVLSILATRVLGGGSSGTQGAIPTRTSSNQAPIPTISVPTPIPTIYIPSPTYIPTAIPTVRIPTPVPPIRIPTPISVPRP